MGITHIVGFKYKDFVSAPLRKEIAHRLFAMSDTSGVIQSVKGGRIVDLELLAKGFHHAFVLKFNRWEDLQFYQQFDQSHNDFKALVEDLTVDVQVWDFEDFEF
ncbi:hypothetical protein E3P77_03194 [Wallemia ichthyophaga]|uniref:Stress-response A/B barrel domain-containing protein n=1 Tax=Wallemia ichthyophaga TaxID=245174 RepID=A0A4T0KVV3_WALIC|nr:hypothetical protein E3P91_00191 [Wallemia ichthyophaga]TIA79717.1 hypothetical protein E3P98_03111 [Wallemia ichthyophaga]TIA93270.1 hypothetical protein E3P97_01048 [Wallemia ichthyophaga]TIA98075.1 hypothetical protein E3P95_02598 [Wallemia ichthyophaga]TIB04577.1 hypothetical protein E3P94_00606 [Wallemia ichthyophaga]